MLLHASLALLAWPWDQAVGDPLMDGGCTKDPSGSGPDLCFPTVCMADSASKRDTALHDHLRGQPAGYDYLGMCDTDTMDRWVVRGVSNSSSECVGDSCPPPAPPSSPVPVPRVGCGDSSSEQPTDMSLLIIWIIAVVYMFYGLAHVCEDFLVPGLNLLCERRGIPEDVAGATLMAAGCNAPELFASAIGVFIQHSTVGAGTVVGSAPFNILCICGAASFAVGGKLYVDGWLMVREIVSLLVVLGLFLLVLDDNVMLWWQAALLVGAYVVYVLVCCFYERILACCLRGRDGGAASGSSPKDALLQRDEFSNSTEPVISSSGTGLSVGGASIGAGSSRRCSRDAPLLASGGATASRGVVASSLNATTFNTEMMGPQTFSELVAECRERCEARRALKSATEPLQAAGAGGGAGGAGGAGGGAGGAGQIPEGSVAPLPSPGAVRVEGVLFKKSRFYSRVRMGKHIWQQRYFVLDGHPTRPFRYHRIVDGGPSSGQIADRSKHVPIELRKVEHLLRISNVELHLVTASLTYKLRCGSDAPTDAIQEWFDELVVRLDEVRAMPPELSSQQSVAAGLVAAVDAEEEDEVHEHHIWYMPPRCGEAATANWLMYLLTIPLKALIHLTIPDVMSKKWRDWYTLTIALAVAWLALLAYLMNLMLAKIGCALGVTETVMGLTIGAIGTSFPNLYASILTARAGQAGMSLCQAFGSNTFNICICLGFIWLLQTAFGTCFLGHGGATLTPSLAGGPCHGCYMPMGLDPNCPFLRGHSAKPQPGSLAGAVYVVFASIAMFVATLVVCRGQVPRIPSFFFFVFYVVYVVYEVLATYEVIAPLCFGSVCI